MGRRGPAPAPARRPGAAQGFRGFRRPRRHQAIAHTNVQCAKRGVAQRVARRRVAVVAAGGSTGHHPQLATRAYRGSHNLRAVQQLLGHASIVTTERYTALCDDEVRAAAAAAW